MGAKKREILREEKKKKRKIIFVSICYNFYF